MLDSSEIMAVMEEAVDDLLAGRRKKYTRLVNETIAEVRTVTTYKTLYQCLIRRAEVEGQALLQCTSTAAVEIAQERVDLLREEAESYQQKLVDLKHQARSQRDTSIGHVFTNTGRHHAVTI